MMKEWVIDVGMPGFGDSVCFIPYDRENDSFVVGMNYVSLKCPGELVGVIDTSAFSDDEMLDSYNSFIKQHPDWKDKFKKEDG